MAPVELGQLRQCDAVANHAPAHSMPIIVDSAMQGFIISCPNIWFPEGAFGSFALEDDERSKNARMWFGLMPVWWTCFSLLHVLSDVKTLSLMTYMTRKAGCLIWSPSLVLFSANRHLGQKSPEPVLQQHLGLPLFDQNLAHQFLRRLSSVIAYVGMVNALLSICGGHTDDFD